MNRKRWWHGGILGLVGFLLSPLSWWNDAFINIPLAIGFGWVISLLYKPAFEPAVVIGYWLTNVLGLVLLHKGVQRIRSDEPPKPYSKKDLVRDLAISLAYTALIVLLLKLKLLQPFSEYLTP
jgi:hypothetical protein